MTLLLLAAIAVLSATGFYLVFDHDLFRTAIGFVLLGHGVNLSILVASLRGDVEVTVDPTGQAMVLTAVVITTAALSLLAALAGRESPETETDEEGR